MKTLTSPGRSALRLADVLRAPIVWRDTRVAARVAAGHLPDHRKRRHRRASNRPAITTNVVSLFDPARWGVADSAGAFALRTLPAGCAGANANQLPMVSEESGRIVEVARTGNLFSTPDLRIAGLHDHDLDPDPHHAGLRGLAAGRRCPCHGRRVQPDRRHRQRPAGQVELPWQHGR